VRYTIAEDTPQKELAGNAVDLRVVVKEVRQKQVPSLDDELAKDTGEADTLAGLRDKVRERLLESDRQRVRGELSQQLVRELIKRNDFPIAPALVERHAQAMAARAKRQLVAAGLDAEAIDERRMIADFRERAEEEARGGILVQAIAEREGISASDADVQKRIAELATARNETPKKIRADLERDNAIPQLEYSIREQKTLDMLISQAKITDGDPATAEKLIVSPDEAKAEKAGKAAKPAKPKTSKTTSKKKEL
jgi:trigger factor